MQETNPLPVQRVYTNRTIEKIFEAYANMKFFLAKDNLYEVIITAVGWLGSKVLAFVVSHP